MLDIPQEEKSIAQKSRILYNTGLIQDNQITDEAMIEKRWLLFTNKRQMSYDEANTRERSK